MPVMPSTWHRRVMDSDAVMRLLAQQDGAVSRRQVLDVGGTDNDIETMIRRRRWARALDGVYVDHTGALSWRQQAWAAVLFHAPSALGGASALRAYGLGAAPDVIEVVVDRSRRVADPPGIRTSQLSDFDRVARLHLGPPRVRLEHAVLTVASRAASEDGCVAVVADACQRRRTTPARLLDEVEHRPRLGRRRLLIEVLDDVAEGAYSALERRYLRDVELAHGLPRGRRQRREQLGGAVVFRDVEYAEQVLLVELDGRLGHELADDRWADLDRDLQAATSGRLTVRLGWRQALEPCRAATAVATLLQARGWTGAPNPCGDGCDLDMRDPPASGAGGSRMSAA